MGVEVPDEGRLVVHGRHVWAGGHPGFRPRLRTGRTGGWAGCAGHRAEPAVADRELLGQVIVDRHVRAVVVAHDQPGSPSVPRAAGSRRRCRRSRPSSRRRSAGRSARGVVRVHRNGRRVEMVHRVGASLVLVREPRRRPSMSGRLRGRGTRACGRTSGSPASRRRRGRPFQVGTGGLLAPVPFHDSSIPRGAHVSKFEIEVRRCGAGDPDEL